MIKRISNKHTTLSCIANFKRWTDSKTTTYLYCLEKKLFKKNSFKNLSRIIEIFEIIFSFLFISYLENINTSETDQNSQNTIYTH
jgi:uncharacterized protein YsxB (DUF464 family)